MANAMKHRPTPLQAIAHIMVKMHNTQPLQQEPLDMISNMKLRFHIAQRMLRLFGTPLLRALVKHPLGWPLSQELLCTMMFGILQSRQVSAWRSFFDAVGDVQSWVPVEKQQVQTGHCSSWWIQLPKDAQPKSPKAHVNWVFFHGGAFVAGHALMYLGTYTYWLHRLSGLGISCSILSVEYPLAPEHPFPAAVEAAAAAVEWLVNESGKTAPYLVGGDSAGGNLTLAALSLLRDQGRLSVLPEALTLLSPAVDLSDKSVFGRKEAVSGHIDVDTQAAVAELAAAAAGKQMTQQQQDGSNPGNPGNAAVPAACGEYQQKMLSLPPQQQPPQKQPQQKQHIVGGVTNPLQLLRGLGAEVSESWAAHSSKAGAAAALARGWFDYLPGPSVADDLHHYLHDPSLLTNPLISPTYMKSFEGLSRQGMLLVAGGAELMRPDIAAFAAKAKAAGVKVQYHEEPGEPHSFAMLAMPHLLKKGKPVWEYVASVAEAAARQGE